MLGSFLEFTDPRHLALLGGLNPHLFPCKSSSRHPHAPLHQPAANYTRLIIHLNNQYLIPLSAVTLSFLYGIFFP